MLILGFIKNIYYLCINKSRPLPVRLAYPAGHFYLWESDIHIKPLLFTAIQTIEVSVRTKIIKHLALVRFTGFLSGKEKDEAIASLSVLAMPSEFENLGNVILEGLIRRIPCIATKGSPWEELELHRCGWWVDFNQKAITNAVKQAMFTSVDDLSKMGQRGRELMENNYSIEAIAKRMKSLYSSILEDQIADLDFCFKI